MNIQDLVSSIKRIELKQLIVGDIEEEYLDVINSALFEVFTRFKIMSSIHIFHSQSGGIYLKTELPDDVAAITSLTRVSKSGSVTSINVNDNSIDSNVSQIGFKTFVVSVFEAEDKYIFSYVQTPPRLTIDNVATISMEIPEILVEPIRAFAGYKAHISQDSSDERARSETMNRLSIYEKAAQSALNTGANFGGRTSNRKLEDRGFM